MSIYNTAKKRGRKTLGKRRKLTRILIVSIAKRKGSVKTSVYRPTYLKTMDLSLLGKYHNSEAKNEELTDSKL